MITVDKTLEDEIRKTVRLATSHAVDFFGAKSPDDITKIERKVFIAKCHEGFELAQDCIIKNLLSLEAKLKAINQEIKEISKGKKEKELRSDDEYQAIRRERENVLSIIQCFRRIADTIVWQILDFNRVLIRSTIIGQDHHGYLEDKNLSSAIDAIKQLKKPGDFYLINDLTSCLGVGSGDLLHVNGDQHWRFIELKTGPINIEVTKFLDVLKERAEKNVKEDGSEKAPQEMLQDPESVAFLEEYGHMFEKGKKEHFERVLRQMHRMRAIQEYEHENVGIDITLNKSGKEKGRVKRAFIPKTEDHNAFDEVDKMLESVSNNTPSYFGLLNFGDFLTLLITDDTKSETFDAKLSPFVREMNARHMIYHHRRQDFDNCAYLAKSREKMQAEFGKEFESYSELPLIGWSDQILRDGSLMPPFLMGLTHEYVFDLLLGRKSIFVFFDRFKFAAYVAAAGGEMLHMKANDNVTREWAGLELKLSPEAKEPGDLGWGMILRMIVEFQEPQTIVDQMVDIYEGRTKRTRREPPSPETSQNH